MKEFVEKLIARLEEKFKYNSEQAEIWRNGSDKDAFFREKKDLYMDRANTYGEVMRIAKQLAEEYNNEDCSKCSRRSWYQKGYKDAEKKFAEEMGVSKMENTTTNADRIRSMSDEELADYIFGVSVGNAPCVLCSEECDFCELTDEECKSKTLAWLQSEVKGSE